MSDQARPTVPPFLRLGTRTGWQIDPAAFGTGIQEVGTVLTLGSADRRPIATTEPYGSFGGRTTPRGLAVTPDGRLLLAAPDRRVVLVRHRHAPDHGPETAPFVPLWPARPIEDPGARVRIRGRRQVVRPPADPYVLVRPTDVAMSPVGDLVVADPGAGRILVLAYPTARLRHVIGIPGGAPTALAFDRTGHAYVADPVLGTVHRYDPAWRGDPSFPHRSAELSAPEHVTRVRVPDPDCGGLPRDPAVVVLDRGRVVVLDHRGRPVPSPVVPELEPGPLRHGPGGELLFDDPDLPRHGPMSLGRLALTRDGRHTGTGLPVLAVPRRVELPRSAALTTTALDGGRPGFPWDRVVLRARIPANTRLVVRTLSDDSPVELDRVLALPDDAWSQPLVLGADDIPELLVQSPAGRFLWLRIQLFGDGHAAPRISGIDVFGPRRSSLRHLPAAYHQDSESRHFLDRFLSYFDTVFAETTAANREFAASLDPRTVPEGDALEWLGSWFDLRFLAEWNPAVRRRMIAEAVAYSRERGTVRGLKRVLQWHTGLEEPLPQIIEHFRLPAETPVLVGGTALDAGQSAHTCTIVLPERVVPDDGARTRLDRLISAHLPGHVRAHLRLVPAGLAVGRQSRVGVDTLLGRPSSGALGEARLGGDFATGDRTARGPRVPDTLRSYRRSQP